jgi:hypothetical protein
MTSIDSTNLGDNFLGHEITLPSSGTRPRPLARTIAGNIGLLVMTGIFLAATIAAVPLTAVYSFIWIAKI